MPWKEGGGLAEGAKKNRNGRYENLCYDCKKATGGCNWSDRFELVEGWDAQKDIVKCAGKKVSVITESYRICDCPEYEEGISKCKMDSDGVDRLCASILRETARAIINPLTREQTYNELLAGGIDLYLAAMDSKFCDGETFYWAVVNRDNLRKRKKERKRRI